VRAWWWTCEGAARVGGECDVMCDARNGNASARSRSACDGRRSDMVQTACSEANSAGCTEGTPAPVEVRTSSASASSYIPCTLLTQ
jgi:hypothetical protein